LEEGSRTGEKKGGEEEKKSRRAEEQKKRRRGEGVRGRKDIPKVLLIDQ
jgi:hypothetical protein